MPRIMRPTPVWTVAKAGTNKNAVDRPPPRLSAQKRPRWSRIQPERLPHASATQVVPILSVGHQLGSAGLQFQYLGPDRPDWLGMLCSGAVPTISPSLHTQGARGEKLRYPKKCLRGSREGQYRGEYTPSRRAAKRWARRRLRRQPTVRFGAGWRLVHPGGVGVANFRKSIQLHLVPAAPAGKQGAQYA